MPVIALLDGGGGGAGLDDVAVDRLVLLVENLDGFAADDCPVAFVQIGDPLCPRSYRERIGAEVIFAVAVADGQRRPHARTDDQVGMLAEQDGNGEGADKPRQHRRDGLLRRSTAFDLARDEMAHDLGVRLAFELPAFRDQLIAERLEVLDDPVVNQGDGPDDVRMRVADRWGAVRRPAGVGDAGAAVERMFA